MEAIFHIATVADWKAAQRDGVYTTSTRGRTLAEVGFIHASRLDQVQPVFDRYYADADEPLVLLVIDPALLTAEVRVEPVGDDTYPHVHGPIEPAAVIEVHPLMPRVAGPAPEGAGQAAIFLPTFFLTLTSLRFLTV